MTEIGQLIKEAKKYLTKYDYENVIKICDEILDINPNSSWGLRFKGISNYQIGNYEEGLKCYQKLDNICPDDNDILYSLANLNEKLENYDETLGYYNQLINNNEYYNCYKVEHKRKQLLMDLKRYDTLINDNNLKLNSLKNNSGSKSEILGLMEENALMFYLKGEYDKSYDLFKKVSQYSPEVKASKTNPLYHSIWYDELSSFLDEYSNPEDFFGEFFKYETDGMSWGSRLKRKLSGADEYLFATVLIEENPGNVKLLEMYADEAKYYYKDFALNCFHKILETEPENKNAIYSIINIYSENYSKDKALRLIDSKLKHSRLRLGLLIEKIELLESMTLYPEALESYERYMHYATRMDMQRSSIYLHYMTCMELYALDLYNQNRLEEAFNLLKEVSRKFHKITNYNGSRYQLAWYSRVLKDTVDKSEDDPIIFFSEFYHLDDENTEIWINKINDNTSQYEPQKLIGNKTYFDILSDENPDNLELALSEARKYYTGIMKPAEALPLYDRVLEIDSTNKEILNHKFKMLVIANRYDEAYDLLVKLPIDYSIISYHLNALSDVFLERREYDKAKYCLNLIINDILDYKIIKKLKFAWDKSRDVESQNESPYYMEWINLINYKHDENICPDCGNKLIPIRYGVIMANDPGFKTHKYYASEEIKAQNNRPTDYCMNCHKQIYMGLCGIDLTEDDSKLSRYAKLIITWLIDYLENNPQTTAEQLKQKIYKEFSINHEECEAFLIKLEKIDFIEYKKYKIRLCQGYAQFKNSINEMYHFTTKIFKNKKELDEYSNTIRKSKEYSNVEEYVEDIKICLMTSGWHYTYESATQLLKGDEVCLEKGLDEADAWDVAMEVGYTCG